MPETLARYYGLMLPAIEQEMKRVLRWTPDGRADELHSAMHYHLGWLDSSFRPTPSSGGKRIRPMLCLLTCAAAGGEWERALPAAVAIELVHNFSLIHDDIEDDSPMRRGRPALWKLLGIPLAINVGDSIFAYAYLALHNLAAKSVSPERMVHAYLGLGRTSVRLTEGQHADMSFESRHEVSVDDYLHMIKGKTAVLLALAAELGALVAGADNETIEHYRRFGKQLGIAFQVKDDILGIWGDEGEIGKSAATDIATRKKTLPVLYGLEKDASLRALYAQPENSADFVMNAVALLNSVGAREFTHDRAIRFTNGALASLEDAAPTGDPAQALLELTDMLLARDL